MEHVRTCLHETNKLIDLFCRFISPRMEELINEEAERIRGNPRNLEMASWLDLGSQDRQEKELRLVVDHRKIVELC